MYPRETMVKTHTDTHTHTNTQIVFKQKVKDELGINTHIYVCT